MYPPHCRSKISHQAKAQGLPEESQVVLEGHLPATKESPNHAAARRFTILYPLVMTKI